MVASGTVASGNSPSIGYTVAAGASADRRVTQFVFRTGSRFDTGSLYGTSLFSTAKGRSPNAPYLILINGGTGDYKGYSGILRVVPTSADGATVNAKWFVIPVG